MLSFFIAFIQLILALFLLYLCLAFVTGAPFVPTTPKASEIMVKLARIKKGNKVIDLGSGDGRLLLLAAEKGALAFGVEVNPFLVFLTKIKLLFSKYRQRIFVSWGNLWKADLQDFDIVFIYLLPWKMKRLEDKILREGKKGLIIVSNSFIFPHLKKIAENTQHHIYVFQIF